MISETHDARLLVHRRVILRARRSILVQDVAHVLVWDATLVVVRRLRHHLARRGPRHLARQRSLVLLERVRSGARRFQRLLQAIIVNRRQHLGCELIATTKNYASL